MRARHGHDLIGCKSPVHFPVKDHLMILTKSTSERQGRKGDLPSEGSRSANLRADGQKPHTRPNPWVRKHNIPKPARRTWGMVNAAVCDQRECLWYRERSCNYPGRSACLSSLTGVVEQSLRRCALKWQKSAEDENPGVLGKGLKAV